MDSSGTQTGSTDVHQAVEDKKDAETEADLTSWSFPSPEAIREELSKEFTREEKEKVWTECIETVKTSYDQLLGRWKEEMDTLLVYAGVSSAVLTAFNVESYHLLQPDPSDPTVAVLKEISAQLSGYILTPPFLNASHITGPGSFTQSPFQASASAVWLNTLWFSSLVFSFASALLALFVKQWIYEAMVGGTSRESARLRQYRLNGMLKWRVGTIVVVLPILLQLASVLFLAGLVVLLWMLHSTVAAVTSLLVAFFFTFFLTVTILPVFKSDCAYRSPASFTIYATLRYLRNEVMRVIRGVCKVIYMWSLQWRIWINVHRARVDRFGEFAYTAYDNMPTWRGRDQNAIYEHHGALNRGIVTSAYSTTADTKFLASMPAIFSDLPPEEVAECFADLMGFMEAEWGQWHLPDRILFEDAITLPLAAVYGIRHMLARSDKGTNNWFVDVHIIFRHYFIGNEQTEKLAELACKSLCHLAVEDPKYRHVYGLAFRTLERMYDRQGARHTYDTLTHARAMYEVKMGTWDPSRGCDSFIDTAQTVYVLLHCLRATISSQCNLSSSQSEDMLAWGHQQLPRLNAWLRDLEWTGMHKGCLAIPGDAAAVLTFPHVVSHHLVRFIIDPVIALCSMPGGRALISEELVTTIERAWSSAQTEYPESLSKDAGFVWCSGLDEIDGRLAELRTVSSKG